MSSMVRYCPSCAVSHVGDDARVGDYTKWRSADTISETWPGVYEYCEYDDRSHNAHCAFIVDGEYWFDIFELGDVCWNGCEAAQPYDDGVSCCYQLSVHLDLWQLMVDAMEREANAGVLDVEKWSANFPKRVAVLVAMSKERAAAALADKLPAVLSGTVLAYLW